MLPKIDFSNFGQKKTCCLQMRRMTWPRHFFWIIIKNKMIVIRRFTIKFSVQNIFQITHASNSKYFRCSTFSDFTALLLVQLPDNNLRRNDKCIRTQSKDDEDATAVVAAIHLYANLINAIIYTNSNWI